MLLFFDIPKGTRRTRALSPSRLMLISCGTMQALNITKPEQGIYCLMSERMMGGTLRMDTRHCQWCNVEVSSESDKKSTRARTWQN